MPDFNVASLQAMQGGSAWALPLLFAAGVFSSIGPCAAPRILALSALILRSNRPVQTTLAFILGTLGVYAAFGFFAGGIMARLSAASSSLYFTLALTAIGGGIVTVASAHWHECAAERPARKDTGSIGIAFASGAGFSLMVSPCCTPVLGVVLAIYTFRANAVALAAMLIVFGIGHAATVLLSCLAGRPLLAWLSRSRFAQGGQVVAGTLMLTMGAYYALLV